MRITSFPLTQEMRLLGKNERSIFASFPNKAYLLKLPCPFGMLFFGLNSKLKF